MPSSDHAHTHAHTQQQAHHATHVLLKANKKARPADQRTAGGTHASPQQWVNHERRSRKRNRGVGNDDADAAAIGTPDRAHTHATLVHFTTNTRSQDAEKETLCRA